MNIEETINKKMQELITSYGNITGKSDTWKNGITILEYAELRRMAISEINLGMATKVGDDTNTEETKRVNTVQNTIQKPADVPNEEKEQKLPTESEETTFRYYESKEKKDDIININQHTQRNEEKSNSVMDKFNRVKDM